MQLTGDQRSVQPVPRSITFDIVSRCLKKTIFAVKFFFCKNAISLFRVSRFGTPLFLQIHFWLLCRLDVLTAGCPDYGFVINKQIAFLQIFVSQQLLFLFSKHLDTMLNVTNCVSSQTDLWLKISDFDDLVGA